MLDLTSRDLGNTGWMRDLSVSHANIGGILEAKGRRDEALREYQEAQGIRLDLTTRDPGNTNWLRDLSVSRNNVGASLEAQGRRDEALRQFSGIQAHHAGSHHPGSRQHRVAARTLRLARQRRLHSGSEGTPRRSLARIPGIQAHRLDLTARDPGNNDWLREFSVSHNKVGAFLEAEGRRDEALREYQESKRIILDRTTRDPGNTNCLRDLSISHNKMGSILAQSPETLTEALAEHQQSLALAERLVQIDPENSDWNDLLATYRDWVRTVQNRLDDRAQQSSVSA